MSELDIHAALQALTGRVEALETELDKRRPTLLKRPRQRWQKRDLYEAIKPLRETGAAWDTIGEAIGISGERCRQVWQIFVVAENERSALKELRDHAP